MPTKGCPGIFQLKVSFSASEGSLFGAWFAYASYRLANNQSKVRSHFSWSTITHDTFTIMWSTITHDHFVKILNDQITIMIGDHFADHAFLKSKYTEGIFLRKEPYILKAHDVRMSKILRSRAFGINLWIFLWKYIPSTQKVYRKTW